VLQHHQSATRDGVFVDPAFTRAAAAHLKRDPTFNATIEGSIYGQLLFLDGGGSAKDLVLAATEKNHVYALDAATGAVVWQRALDPPAPSSALPCGNISPLGITGTPVIDPLSKTIYLDLMSAAGNQLDHKVYALSIADGSTKSGWPVSVGAKVGGFVADHENQRGALLLLNGILYVPYGGHYGDCQPYKGWVIAIPIDHPDALTSWSTRASGSGAWSPGGLASDGKSIFVATGNSPPGTSPWGDEEAIVRLGAGATYSQDAVDYFHPTDWQDLDNSDTDVGGSGPVLFSVPPNDYVLALGKNGKAYVLDRANLGGMGEGLVSQTVSASEIINAGAAYTTANGTYLVFKGNGINCPMNQSGNLIALKVGASSPPTLTTVWCADQHGSGSPMVTTTDGRSEAIVWAAGTEGEGGGGDSRLHGFDADSGVVVFDGGGANDTTPQMRRSHSPIAAKGRIYVGADDAVVAFTLK
jgi:outer membrane protein assembly factor BamB